jgi:hypothetical protein
VGKGRKGADFEENGNSLFVSKAGSKAVVALDEGGCRIGKEKLGKGWGPKGAPRSLKRMTFLAFWLPCW